MDYAAYVLSLTVSEFRAMRKAINVLCRAGIYRDEAIRILMTQHQMKSGK